MAKRGDLSVTLLCNSEEARTRVNSDGVFSDEDFPAVFGARDIRQSFGGAPVHRAVRPEGQLGLIASMSPPSRWLTL